MFTDSIRNTRKKQELCSKLTIKTLRNVNEVALMFFLSCFSVFIVNFEYIFWFCFSLLALNKVRLKMITFGSNQNRYLLRITNSNPLWESKVEIKIGIR